MTTTVAVKPLTITACGVVSPAGLGLDALESALRSGVDAYTAPQSGFEDVTDSYPPRPAWAVPDLKVAEHLGRKGLRHIDRFTMLGLIACKLAFDESGTVLSDEDRAETGVVMATNTGSLVSMLEVGRDTLLQEKPYLVNPARFPNVVTNACTGQIAIRNSLTGVNVVVSGGQAAGLAAVRFARTTIGDQRSRRLLVGGIEELSEVAAWGWHKSGALHENAPVGEGSAVFLVEDGEAASAAGRTGLADLLACEVGYYGARDAAGRAEGLRSCVERALDRSGVSPGEVDVVSLGATNHRGLDDLEEQALQEVLDRPVPKIRVSEVLGELYSASVPLQVAAILALWRGEPAEHARVALVTSIGGDGNAGCLVVRECR
ncbi:beta-ketoacyl synthase N-terminal-like domain-containing protein [Streptosporangium sp. NPDC051023]|uniref:beta-ketoacyl synthase N-terminal-like domain-containing protein n=1 Tax=Streptosporangium sp. NPDC051023 TaxID=3155410 RepID=UPI00344C9D83